MRSIQSASILFYFFMLCSCASQHEPETGDEESVRDRVSVAVSVAGIAKGEQKLSMFVFKKNAADKYTFYDTVTEGWIADSNLKDHMTTTLPLGQYKFLFASNYGINTVLGSLVKEVTPITEFSFMLADNQGGPGSDNLFLDADFLEANTVYDLAAPNVHTRIVRDLKRAVGRVEVSLKRGVRQPGKQTFDSIPYPDPQTENIYSKIESVSIQLNGVGYKYKEGVVQGETAQVNVNARVDDSFVKLNESGFADMVGPYVFPTPTDAETLLTVTIYPKDKMFKELTVSQVIPRIDRNKIARITLWMTADYVPVGITISQVPWTDQLGDEGVWE